MRQALHIFRKDIRHSLYEIVVVLAMTAAFTAAESRRPWFGSGGAANILGLVLPLAWWSLIASLVHAESLAGDRQFWITRPYSWKSLLAAKILGVAAFINLPLLISYWIILAAQGLVPLHSLGGLLWAQVAITIVYLLPAAAVASITRNLAQFAVIAFLVLAAAVGFETAMEGHAGPVWGSLSWLRVSAWCAVSVTAASIALLWQYKHRRTASSRIVLLAGFLLIAALSLGAPWSAAWAVQSHLHGSRGVYSGITVVPATGISLPERRGMWAPGGNVRLHIPLRVTGLAPDADLVSDAVTIAIGGWRSERSPSNYLRRLGGGPDVWWVEAFVPAALTRTKALQDIHLSLALTVFLPDRTASVPVASGPLPVGNVGVCLQEQLLNEGRNPLVICRSALRAPPRTLVYLEDGGRRIGPDTLSRTDSHSPYPADATVGPVHISIGYAAVLREASAGARLVFVTERPAAHLRREVDVRGVNLLSLR